MTVLVVEDDPAVRRAARLVLERAGYVVLLAENGEEGAVMLAELADQVGLVVSDVVMPQVGGLELYEHVRRQRPDLPFVLTSGYSMDNVRVRVADDPYARFLPKPWTPDELLQAVDAVRRADA